MSSHIVPTRVYLIVYALLMVLLVLTLASAEMDLGRWNIVMAMTIAVAKAVIIVLYFMHLRYSGRMVSVFAAAGFVWLAILLSLMMSDYVTRVGSPAVSTPAQR
jgi:cytochrome c oxidase subunit 4